MFAPPGSLWPRPAARTRSGLFEDNNEGGWFSKPVDIFAKPSWASAPTHDKNIQLNPHGPVAPEDLVGADGRCAAPAAEPPPAAPAGGSAGSRRHPGGSGRPAGRLHGRRSRQPPMPAADPGLGQSRRRAARAAAGRSPDLGGIALGMSECDVVRRAGLPGNVNISAGDKGERKVVLTYLSGTWPGIYTFRRRPAEDVDRAPVPPPSAKPPAKKKAGEEAGQAEDRRQRAIDAGLRAVDRPHRSRGLERRAGGEPFLFRLGNRGHDLRARLGQLGGARRIAGEQRAVGERGVELVAVGA